MRTITPTTTPPMKSGSTDITASILMIRGQAAMNLNSPVAVEMSVHVVRAVIRKLKGRLNGNDAEIAEILEALRRLMVPPEPEGLEIGFLADHRQQ